MLIYILLQKYADVVELADTLDLGSSGKPWGFKSLHPHQVDVITSLVLTISEVLLLKRGKFGVVMSVVKNQEYIVDILDNGYQGEGIAKLNDLTIFIQNAIKGEKVKILITKVTKFYAYGKLLEIIEKSSDRVEEDCTTYKRCGGCSLRHIEYEKTLEVKKQIVENCLYKELKEKIDVENTIGMKEPYHYRNKLQYPIGIDKNNKHQIGVYAVRTHEIVPVDKCFIQNVDCENIAKDIFQFAVDNNLSVYNETTLKGSLRHIIVKIGVRTNEIMAILVVNDEFGKDKELVEYLVNKYKNIKSIVKNINNKNTNVILGNITKTIYGQDYIYDILGDYKFKISPRSFYQVNPVQTEILYNKALEFADLKGNETAFDLYCGIGTIAIFMARYVEKVYGIEIIDDAIKNAKDNAEVNNIRNAEFIVGDVEKIFPELVNEQKIKADVVFVDPPRSGCEAKTIDTLLQLEPEKVIYISCNPATLARDLRLMSVKYDVVKVQPVDMFPFTHNIETVNLLILRTGEKMK